MMILVFHIPAAAVFVWERGRGEVVGSGRESKK